VKPTSCTSFFPWAASRHKRSTHKAVRNSNHVLYIRIPANMLTAVGPPTTAILCTCRSRKKKCGATAAATPLPEPPHNLLLLRRVMGTPPKGGYLKPRRGRLHSNKSSFCITALVAVEQTLLMSPSNLRCIVQCKGVLCLHPTSL